MHGTWLSYAKITHMPSKRSVSRIHLTLIPFLVAVLGFAVGHIPYTVYIPIWLINACLMLLAAWTVAANGIRSEDNQKKELAGIGLIMIIPWILFSIFFGMGPPPVTIAGWLETAGEQQTRYYILIIGGIVAVAGFVLLREWLKKSGENFYSLLGLTATLIAIPLFIINMAYWGSFLTEAFRHFQDASANARPAWYLSLRSLFYSIGLVEVSLFYLATAAFAASFKKSRIFKSGTCNTYIIVSIAFFILSILPPSSPEPLASASYLTSIPAIPFIMPYLMGVHLLWRAGA
jgi:hypothetical protein